jgi:hypothetical protein
MLNISSTRCAALAGAATAALALAPASLAATVTVRVQGRTKTLLPTKTVHLKPGSITRGGAATGACSATSAQGALADATRGNWQGSWYSSYNEYYITGILGLEETGKSYYWGLYVNNRFATAGACDEPLKPGSSVVFAVVPAKGSTEQLLGVQTPAARAGFPYTVQVVAYDAHGKARPLGGATVSVDGRRVVTQKNGWTPGITFPAAGEQTLTVTKSHYVGTEATVDVGSA